MRKVFVVCLLATANLLARAASDCRGVGGTISTNFVSASATLGSATGDLSGGIGVSVLSVTQNPDGTLTFHNQHSWVTASGETIETKPATATAFSTGIQGLYAVSYTDGIVVTGGTGRFANARGNIRAWGAANLATNEIVLRYEGKTCSAHSE